MAHSARGDDGVDEISHQVAQGSGAGATESCVVFDVFVYCWRCIHNKTKGNTGHGVSASIYDVLGSL